MTLSVLSFREHFQMSLLGCVYSCGPAELASLCCLAGEGKDRHGDTGPASAVIPAGQSWEMWSVTRQLRQQLKARVSKTQDKRVV